MNTFEFIIDYISIGTPNPDPKYLLIQPVIQEDGIHRWSRVIEKISYPINENNEIVVPYKEQTLFQNWTGLKLKDGKCQCPNMEEYHG